MCRAVLLLVVIYPALALSAPVPPLTERQLIAKYWGEVYSPSDKYVFKAREKALTIRTAGEPAIEGFLDKRSTIPRTSRAVTGDFEATVKLIAISAPHPTAKHEVDLRSVRAGLRVSGGFNHAEIELYQYHTKLNDEVRKGNRKPVVWFNVLSNGRGEGRHVENADSPTPLFLRIARRGNVVTMANSFDGKEWSESPVPLAYQPLKLPDEVSVGVYISHPTHQIAEATFTDFTIKKYDKK